MTNYCKSEVIITTVFILVFLLSGAESNPARVNPARFADPKAVYVILYEHESFRGGEHIVNFKKTCINLPEKYSNWASSVDAHRSCATVCGSKDCKDGCVNVYSRQGISKLRLVGLNDKIKSVKACY